MFVFKGKIPLNGYVFDGQNADPLRFALLNGSGLVYLRGKGTVTMKDGTTLSLPQGE